jgi:hypothetical protein
MLIGMTTYKIVMHMTNEILHCGWKMRDLGHVDENTN